MNTPTPLRRQPKGRRYVIVPTPPAPAIPIPPELERWAPLLKAVDFTQHSGIYFVIDQETGRVDYVGQSVDVRGRCRTHDVTSWSGPKHYLFIPLDPAVLQASESAFVRELRKQLRNVQLPRATEAQRKELFDALDAAVAAARGEVSP
jgi:hypothetical protein